MASDQQLHFVLQSLNYSTLYDLTHGQFKASTVSDHYKASHSPTFFALAFYVTPLFPFIDSLLYRTPRSVYKLINLKVGDHQSQCLAELRK